jgi:hypothetical protein
VVRGISNPVGGRREDPCILVVRVASERTNIQYVVDFKATEDL